MKRAFTLIELLVVIAIIAILAAILFPVFAQAKAAAKNTADLSNIKQVSLANLMYAGDADDLFVQVGATDNDQGGWETPHTSPTGFTDRNGVRQPWRGWGLLLQPYVKSRDMFRSPFFPKTGSFTGGCASSNGMELSNNYSINFLLGRDGGYGTAGDGDYGSAPDGTRLNTPVSQTAVNQPANTIAFLPSNSAPPYGRTWGCWYVSLEASDYINKIRFHTFHNEGGNLAFVDGHSKFYQAKQANAAGNATKTGPSHTIYHWASRGMWMQPTMPDSTMGYQNTGGIQ